LLSSNLNRVRQLPSFRERCLTTFDGPEVQALVETIVIVLGAALIALVFCWTPVWPCLYFLGGTSKDNDVISDKAKEQVSHTSEDAPSVIPSDQPAVLTERKRQPSKEISREL
jgi:hypothetical protein